MSDLDASLSGPEEPPATSVTNLSGGVNLGAQRDVIIGGDVVGRDKITTVGYTVEQVSTLLTQISSTFQPNPFAGRCPYLGLDAFTEDEADRFFGRERLISDLLERVKTARFLIIAGPSGSGKSSLVRAGLIHALKQGALPNSDRWLYATLTPGRDPIESLALALSRMAKSPDAGDYVRGRKTEVDALHKFAESLLSDRQDQRAVIFVDQFEEVFTPVSKEDERIAFLNLLTQAATQENGRVTVLFTLRSDFVLNCARYPQLNALLNQQFMQVGAMQSDELVSAIARPALQVGLRIDPDLVAQIVNDMGDEPGILPLMQFALKDLFDAQQARGDLQALTLNDYLARGGLRKALERHADAAFAQLSENEQQLARTIFGDLIEIGHGHQDTRRTAAYDELVPANVEAAQVNAVVQKLADARLITTDKQGDKDTVTISHERLIQAWPWLQRLVSENREAIALQNQIAEDAQEWEKNRRDASYLYIGARLATAREQLAEQKIVLSELEQRFVTASVEAEDSAHQREKEHHQQEIQRLQTRNRLITAVGLIAFAAMLVAVFFGIQSNQNASAADRNAATAEAARALSVSEANSRATAEADALKQRDEAQHQGRIGFYRRLAAQATGRLSDDFDLALLLSLETARIGDTISNTYASPDGSDSYEGRDSVMKALESNLNVADFLFGHSSWVGSVAFSPDGKTLASGSADGSVILWDVATRQRLGVPLTDQSYAVSAVTFSPDGKTLASGSCGKIVDHNCTEGAIILWDVATHQRLNVPLIGHSNWVQSIAFSPDGKTLASGSKDTSVILWDVATRQRLGSPLTGHFDTVWSVAFSPDSKTLASGSCGKIVGNNCTEGAVFLWDVATRQRLGDLLTGHSDVVYSVAFSRDGKTLASGSADRSVILWDVATRQRLGSALIGHFGGVTSVAFSQDGKMLASGSLDKNIILWDVATRQRLGAPLTGHSDVVYSVAFSRDGKTLASGSADRSVILWDVAMRHRLGTPLTGQSYAVTSVAFSPMKGDKTLASGSCGKIVDNSCTEGAIILWNMATRQRLGEPLTGHFGAVSSVAFSPDGKTLASGSWDKSIILWDVATRQRLGDPLTGYFDAVWSVAFSPDGKTLASGSCGKIVGNNCTEGAIFLWDVATRQRLGDPLTGHFGAVSSVAFSRDGKTLASGSWDKSIILWDVATRQRLGDPLTGHFDAVWSVAFSPDSKTLASGSRDNAVILWDVVMRQRLGGPLIDRSYPVSSVAFSPDGKTLASGSWGQSVILWDVDLESWKARVCQMVGRNLTRSEWAQYLGGEPYRKTCEQWPLEPEATPTPIPTPTP